MSEYVKYRRTQIAELRPYRAGESLDGVSISEVDAVAGSPRVGDMIARNPKNHGDRWLVAAQYFADNFEREALEQEFVSYHDPDTKRRVHGFPPRSGR